MTDSFRSCPSCGARIRSTSSVCDLCGYDLDSGEIEGEDAGSSSGGPQFCSECGSRNTAQAKFCSQCGTPLSSKPAQTSPPPISAQLDPPEHEKTDEESGIGKQVALLVGGAVLIVMALYMVTLVSKQNVTTGGVQAAVPPAATSLLEEHDAVPLSAEAETQVEQLKASINQADGEERRAHQRALIDLLYEADRPDLAAIEAQYVAEETGALQDWRDAGDLYFQWTESAEPELRSDLAHLTIFAYERVLEQDPDNFDVRSNVAWVAQYDAANPMRAIDEINYILEREPDHLQANFNRGYFLMRINRFDQAVDQMERVLELTDESSPIGRQAATLVQIIREEQGRMGRNR